ncbi:MAG TPA: AAA family ATPase [Xanthobacteraceae bacterium]|nr:AAA family ATPase [Xanthobacteraceae bacterium]
MTDDPQAAVMAYLEDPATYGGLGGLPVRRFDTHASTVFLAGERALKVKRAVRFPFLDYSTLDRRKAACAAEIEVNRRFAPGIYRGIVPITRDSDGRLALGGDGEPVEWAVEMRRFDESKTLDLVAASGSLDPGLADRLGRAVARAHAAAPAVEAAPWVAALADYIGQNARAFAEHAQLFPAPDAARLTDESRAALARIRPLLLARGERGLVRRGHGDLHLGNIALIDGEPVPFDAVEFDTLVASGDVFYDLAFLLMDLLARGARAAGNIVFNRYLIDTHRPEDLDALAALPLFLSLRAAIRAKVTAERLARARTGETGEIAAAAQAYFRLALDLVAPPAPVFVCIGGLSGTGKSVLARALAPDIFPAPGAVVLRSDVERKLMFGVGETERLGAEAYAPDVTARVYATLADKAKRAASAGHSVIVDAVFADPAERAAIAQAAQASGIAFRPLFLQADVETRTARVGARSLDASDADAAIARRQEVYAIGDIAWSLVDASGTPDDTLERAKAALADLAALRPVRRPSEQ